MKRFILACLVMLACFNVRHVHAETVIRVNRLGYLPDAVKVAVWAATDDGNGIDSFTVHDALTDEKVFESRKVANTGEWGPFKRSCRLDFSGFGCERGAFYIAANGLRSPVFRIAWDVWDGSADFILRYMRQQRCGYNPCLKDSCHTHDGFMIYHPDPARDSTHVDVTGGWHDATDYLQYLATSANAVHQMLFAYRENPEAFGDAYDASGDPGANGVPDIIDEARWGLEWLVKMNPEPRLMFNQIADDRDHSGFRLPNKDETRYGRDDLQRPIYVITGEVQGILEHKNRTRGVSSSAAKYTSAFALGADVMREFDPSFADKIAAKALPAYEFALERPGACQTAPGTSPYFYEEDNWVDDMELAAFHLAKVTGDRAFLHEAAAWGRQEKTTPWMGADYARHYQWYPFVNIGHALLAANGPDDEIKREFAGYLREGLEKIRRRGAGTPFLSGVPFIWCSNNFMVAAATQCRLYREISGDRTYDELEAAIRDWLFGTNPWGTSMICNFPAGTEVPEDPHSSLWIVEQIPTAGGLVDGPVYGSVFRNLKWLKIINGDEFAAFQSDEVVYHDDYGDYSTNEPTMDGTASLSYYLSGLQKDGMAARAGRRPVIEYGGMVRTDPTKKEISLVFTAHTQVDGYETIRKTLKKQGVKGSFFFTGEFYRRPEFAHMVKGLKADGHYLGAHSDKHILYCTWEKRDSTLVSREEVYADVINNYREMAKHGIDMKDAPLFMPPYEWYNDTISQWVRELGLHVVNMTPATWTNQDWTIPDNPDFPYYSSDDLLGKLEAFEERDPNELNGAILLIHFGTDERRTDKLYNRMDNLITDLKAKGYRFTRIDEAAYGTQHQ